MGNIKDSGKTQEFKSGAHRDDAVGKGRPDLIPISPCSSFDDPVLSCINQYIETENVSLLDDAITQSLADAVVIRPNGKIKKIPDTATDAEARAAVLLDVSLLYEAGADKYGENNWKRGMPVIRFLQSAMRHWLKHKAGWRDEPHYRAFVWNILCAIWMHSEKPEYRISAETPDNETSDGTPTTDNATPTTVDLEFADGVVGKAGVAANGRIYYNGRVVYLFEVHADTECKRVGLVQSYKSSHDVLFASFENLPSETLIHSGIKRLFALPELVTVTHASWDEINASEAGEKYRFDEPIICI